MSAIETFVSSKITYLYISNAAYEKKKPLLNQFFMHHIECDQPDGTDR